MTFTYLSKDQLLPPSQQVMKLLSLSEKHPKASYKEDAAALIKKYSAEKLFVPDENLGKNVLHYAISTNNPMIAIDLINKAGVTSEQLFHNDTYNFTPLHEAIDKDKILVARELIRKATTSGQLQCETHVHDDHKTAMQMAEDKSMTDVVRDLKKRIKDLSANARQKKLPPRYRTNQQSALGI